MSPSWIVRDLLYGDYGVGDVWTGQASDAAEAAECAAKDTGLKTS